MQNRQLNPVVRFLRQIAIAHNGAEPDRLLLERFALRQDETAFAILVQRHAPLVWGICRRILQHQQDAEDAFQATFLVLARKAHSIRRRESIDSWLFGVAYRVAQKARSEAIRRHIHERRAVPRSASDPLDAVMWHDLRPLLDEAIHSLPEKYRLPFILCHLQGKTNEEAARQLRCPLGTVLSRLARARQLLRSRLSRRGFVLSTGVLTALIVRHAEAAVPASLIEATIPAGVPFAVCQSAVGVVSAHVLALAEGGMKGMFVTKLTLTVALITLTAFGVGTGALTSRVGVEAAAPARAQPPAAGGAAELTRLVRVASPCDGVVVLVATEIKAGEKVPADRLVRVNTSGGERTYRRLKRGDAIEPGQLLVLLDDRIIVEQVANHRAKVEAARADLRTSEKTRDEAYQRYLTTEKLRRINPRPGMPAIADEEVRGAKLTWERYKYEVDSKKATVAATEAELKQTKTILEQTEIRSRVRGVIKSIPKQPGEAVRALETVIILQVRDDPD
jgi:RNA polymerase sigma factor (sigma-70 family)